MHRVGARDNEAEDGVAALVVRDPRAILLAHQQRTLRTEDDLLQRVEEILLSNVVLIPTRSEQRGFVHEILDVGAGEPRRRGGYLADVHVLTQRDAPCVHLEYRGATGLVGKVDDDMTIEAPWT